MLKVHRNSIYILFPLLITSVIISVVFNFLAINENNPYSWYPYGCDIEIGIMSSSLLSLILEYIGYFREKRIILEAYYDQVEKMVHDISKYKECKISDEEIISKNIDILKSVLYGELKRLGNLYSQFAFLIDKKFDKQGKREYLFAFYQYFTDIESLIRNDLYLLSQNIKIQSKLDYIDNIILNVKQQQYDGTLFTSVTNRICDDLDNELNILISLANGKCKVKSKLNFNKTVLTDKVFEIENEEIEQQLGLMNQKVEEANSRQIEVSDIENLQISYLLKKDYIIPIICNKDGKPTTVEVEDKAYYYFGYKKRYKKARHSKSECDK